MKNQKFYHKKFIKSGCIASIACVCLFLKINYCDKCVMKANAVVDTDWNILENAKAGISLLDFTKITKKGQDLSFLDDGDVDILLRIAAAEAGSEDVIGKALVMRVVLNRMESREFPDTVREVVFQKVSGKYQFSPAGDGSYQSAEITESCYEALDLILSGWDKSCGAMYFCTPKAADKWHEDNLAYLFQHGGHKFYGDKGLKN